VLQKDQPKFAEAMTDFLKECFLRASRPSIVQAMMPGATAKFEADRQFMTSVAERSTSAVIRFFFDHLDYMQSLMNGEQTLLKRKIC